MLSVGLLTRPGRGDEALRDIRLRDRLRVPIILLLLQHRPDASRHPVGQLDCDKQLRFALQHPREPTPIRHAKPCCRADHRHGPDSQQASNVLLSHLRDFAEPVIAARRLLQWHEAYSVFGLIGFRNLIFGDLCFSSYG